MVYGLWSGVKGDLLIIAHFLLPGVWRRLLLEKQYRSEYRGASPIRKRLPPQNLHTALGMGLLKGPQRRRFLVSEVPPKRNNTKASKSFDAVRKSWLTKSQP